MAHKEMNLVIGLLKNSAEKSLKFEQISKYKISDIKFSLIYYMYMESGDYS